MTALPRNGFSAAEMKPWHAKYSYQTFDEQGNQEDQGTFEAWASGENKQKLVWTSARFSQTFYRTPGGNYWSVPDLTIPYGAFQFIYEIMATPSNDKSLESAEVQKTANPLKKANLSCFESSERLLIAFNGRKPLYDTPEIRCFEPDTFALRYAGRPSGQGVFFQHIGTLDHHYIGIDIEVMDGARHILTAHLEQGNLLSSPDEALFTPPATAVKSLATPINDPEAYAIAGKRMSGESPEYPSSAKQARAQGTVALRAVIGKDGHVTQLTPISSPDGLLTQSAMKAVRTWVYHPNLVDNEPVSVETQINVVYKLGA